MEGIIFQSGIGRGTAFGGGNDRWGWYSNAYKLAVRVLLKNMIVSIVALCQIKQIRWRLRCRHDNDDSSLFLGDGQLLSDDRLQGLDYVMLTSLASCLDISQGAARAVFESNWLIVPAFEVTGRSEALYPSIRDALIIHRRLRQLLQSHLQLNHSHRWPPWRRSFALSRFLMRFAHTVCHSRIHISLEHHLGSFRMTYLSS